MFSKILTSSILPESAPDLILKKVMIKGACLKGTNKQKRYKKNLSFLLFRSQKVFQTYISNSKVNNVIQNFDMPIHYVTYKSSVKSTDSHSHVRIDIKFKF